VVAVLFDDNADDTVVLSLIELLLVLIELTFSFVVGITLVKAGTCLIIFLCVVELENLLLIVEPVLTLLLKALKSELLVDAVEVEVSPEKEENGLAGFVSVLVDADAVNPPKPAKGFKGVDEGCVVELLILAKADKADSDEVLKTK
jgi:hypothetical protein